VKNVRASSISLPRNFLHSAELQLTHPRTGKTMGFKSSLPAELQSFLAAVDADTQSPSHHELH